MGKEGSVSKGDIIRLDYKAYISDNEKVFDTTLESAAKDAGIFDEKQKYAPVPYRVGSGAIFPALDDAIVGAAVGKETKVTITSENGAGARNPNLIQVHSMKEFSKMDVAPYPGLEVSLNNKRGTIVSVGAGRVRVDFNNPLAGKDVVYAFTVKEVVKDAEEKAKAILEMDFGTSDDFKFLISKEKVTVTVSEITKFHQEWPIAKYKVVADLRETFGVDTVEFIEIWSKAPKEKAADAPAEEKKKAPAKKEKAAEENAVKKEAKATVTEVKKEAAKPKAPAKPKVNDADKAKSQAQKKK